MVDLKPCPFCGGRAEQHNPEQPHGGMVHCVSCGAEAFGPKWDRRVALPAVPASAADLPVGIEGFGASYIRKDDHWVIYTMPGCVPFGTVKGYDKKRLDWTISALRAIRALIPQEGKADG